MNEDHSEIDQVKIMSCVSSSPFLRQASFNTSADAEFSLKRKIDDSDYERRVSKKDCPAMSPWEFRRLRTELVDAQAQVFRLEERLDNLHKINTESAIFFDKEKSEMKSNLEASRRQVKMLETQLDKVRLREKEAQEHLKEVKASYDESRLVKDQRLAELQRENANLLERLTDMEVDATEKMSTLIEKTGELEKDIERMKSAVDEERDRANSAEARLMVLVEDYKDVEEVQMQLREVTNRVQELEAERDEWEEARAVATILQDRLLRLEEVEKELKESQAEVANLRMAVTGNVLMEEKLHTYVIKEALAAEREKEFIESKAKIFELETELEKWVKMVENHCDGSTREDLLAHLNASSATIMKNSLDRNFIEAELQKTVADLKEAQESLKAGQKAAEEMKTVIDKARTEVQLLRRKIALVTRERDSYRQQLDLFEKDLTVTGIGATSETEPNQLERVHELENILQGYREQMESLETQLAVYKNEDKESQIETIRKLEQQLSEAQAKIEQLSTRRDELEEMLEQRVRQGGYPSPSTRILHFRNNPCAVAEQQQAANVEKLEKENDCLRARIRLLESGEHLDLTTRAAADVESVSTARVKELEEQLESANLKNTRLKEVFKRTSQDFRNVSYMLLGYRIDLISNKVYKLTNMYSDDPDDHFMFQLNRSGMMEMLETPFTQTFAELVDEHLHRKNSIPSFLSAVTLSLQNAAESVASESDDDNNERNDSDEPIEVEISD